MSATSGNVVTVDLADRSYEIHVSAGLLSRAGALLAPYARDGRLLVITDSEVERHVLPALLHILSDANITCETFVLPSGEGAKSWKNLEELTDWLLDQNVERGDHIIALGGGVVGDITGFAAHIVKRGCGFVQIPTTLLAQVDSSVGGKTAINSRTGKNLVGAFHQPALVLIDPGCAGQFTAARIGCGFCRGHKIRPDR